MSLSDKYQHIFHEISISDEMFANLPNSVSLDTIFNPNRYNEQVLDAQDQLIARIKVLAESRMTQRQNDVFQLVMIQGLTMAEAGKQMKVTENSVRSYIEGNTYGNIKYGGLLKKLNKAIKQDQTCQILISTIQEITQERDG